MYVLYTFYGGLLGFGILYLLAFVVMNWLEIRVIWHLKFSKEISAATLKDNPELVQTIFLYSAGVPGSRNLPSWLGDVYEIFFVIFIGPAWINHQILFLFTFIGAALGFAADLYFWF